MALINCTINSTSVEVTPSQVLGSGVANQVLTITPNAGFRVSASDFVSASPPTGVSSIVRSNSGTAYAANNTVLITVDLDNSFNPGTNNHTFTIDIDGAAVSEKDLPKTLSGTFNVTLTNATTAASNVAYTGSASPGTTVDLFTRTVTATSGNYFRVEPSYVISSGNENNYIVTTSTTSNSDGLVVTKTFNVDGIIPTQNDTSDVITISGAAEAVPVALNRINSYSIDTLDAPYSLTKRGLTVYGDVDAKFEVNIVRSGDSHTYDFSAGDFTSSSTNSGTLTIASNGQHAQLITLPVVVADVTYTFTISRKSPTVDNITQTNPFTINRRGFKSVTVNATSTSRGTFQSRTITYTNYASTAITPTASGPIYGQANGVNSGDTNSEFNFNIIVDDDQAFVFSSNSLSSSMALTDAHYSITPSSGKADLGTGTAIATRSADSGGNANQLLTISGGDWYNYQHGTSNTVINFNIDNFCVAAGSGGNPGSGNVLTYGSTQFQDVTGGLSAILYPSGYIQQLSGRASGSTTVTYTLAGINLQGNDFPAYVNTVGDVTVTAGNYSNTTTKFNSANYGISISSFAVNNQGTSSRSLFMDVTVTITSFSPAIASGDHHNLKVMIAFANDGANP